LSDDPSSRRERRKIRSVATITLLLEAALTLILVWSTPLDVAHRPESFITTGWMLALLAAAMGVQTATMTRLGALTIHTTFVTGMLNELAQSISQWLFWMHDDWEKQVSWRERLQHPMLEVAGFTFGIWICYVVGSVAGAWMSLHWNIRSLYVAGAMLAIAAGIDQVHPLSLEEEKDQP
jgi:uncharacterized membrane protein YoaK (UPF0700 family)